MNRIALAAAAGVLCTSAAAASLQILTENNPPFNYPEGNEVKGTATQAVRDMLQKSGVDAKIDVMKWDDAYARAQSSPNTCIFSTARLENREKLFKWYGPIAQNIWTLYSLPSFDKKIATARDARFYVIGGVKNDAKVDFMRSQGASSIREAAKNEDNPARLLKPKGDRDHIDLWITTSATAKEIAAAGGVKDLREVLQVRKQDLYLACNPRSDAATLAKLGAAAKK